ncbi:MAG: pyruvate carboxyltransferase [Deltaproteobacteria bacterium]|nr:pyruvate carboxyltransferase [Deltaproteobacteria bacterium]
MKGLIDTTLREGAQTVGINFPLSAQQDIIRGLIGIGIEEIELGVVTPRAHDLARLIDFCRRRDSNTIISLWSMCRRRDIEYAAALQPDILSLSIPVSDLHIYKKLRKSRDWILRTLDAALDWARDLGIKRLSLGLEDATRAETSFLLEVLDTAAKGGVFRIRLADTVGIATPLSMVELLKKLNTDYELEFGVHSHNDFGMATANCLTALEAGADWADVTILGLGERAGNARLEEAAAYLALRHGRPYRTECIRTLSELVGAIIGQDIPTRRPVVGRDIFTCESGLHLQGLEREPGTYEPYSPQRVGAKRRLLYGEKIGRQNIRRRLGDPTHSPWFDNINDILEAVRQKTSELGRPLEDAELTALCRHKG